MLLQKFNKKTDRWVKYKKEGNRTTILDVKNKEPTIPFKRVRFAK